MPFRRLGLACAAAAVLAAPAGAQDLGLAVRETYPTNESMLSQAVKAAVAELFVGFSAPEGASLLVQTKSDHKANWFVESQILAYLSDAGYRAYLKQEPMLGPPAAAFLDSAGAAVAETLLAETEDPIPDYTLRYRVVLCELSYPEKYRKSPLGARQIQRRASVSLQGRLLHGSREDVVWVGNGNVDRVNVVPAGKLPLLAGTEFPFNPPAISGGGFGSLVEPALVTGIVAGLVYLFYTNQD
jgi:hypothetical protein